MTIETNWSKYRLVVIKFTGVQQSCTTIIIKFIVLTVEFG